MFELSLVAYGTITVMQKASSENVPTQKYRKLMGTAYWNPNEKFGIKINLIQPTCM